MMMINVKTAQRKLTAEKYDEEWDFALSVPLCPGLPGAIVMSEMKNLVLVRLFFLNMLVTILINVALY